MNKENKRLRRDILATISLILGGAIGLLVCVGASYFFLRSAPESLTRPGKTFNALIGFEILGVILCSVVFFVMFSRLNKNRKSILSDASTPIVQGFSFMGFLKGFVGGFLLTNIIIGMGLITGI